VNKEAERTLWHSPLNMFSCLNHILMSPS